LKSKNVFFIEKLKLLNKFGIFKKIPPGTQWDVRQSSLFLIFFLTLNNILKHCAVCESSWGKNKYIKNKSSSCGGRTRKKGKIKMK
jgi:hypothetical protein